MKNIFLDVRLLNKVINLYKRSKFILTKPSYRRGQNVSCLAKPSYRRSQKCILPGQTKLWKRSKTYPAWPDQVIDVVKNLSCLTRPSNKSGQNLSFLTRPSHKSGQKLIFPDQTKPQKWPNLSFRHDQATSGQKLILPDQTKQQSGQNLSFLTTPSHKSGQNLSFLTRPSCRSDQKLILTRPI